MNEEKMLSLFEDKSMRFVDFMKNTFLFSRDVGSYRIRGTIGGSCKDLEDIIITKNSKIYVSDYKEFFNAFEIEEIKSGYIVFTYYKEDGNDA